MCSRWVETILQGLHAIWTVPPSLSFRAEFDVAKCCGYWCVKEYLTLLRRTRGKERCFSFTVFGKTSFIC